MLVIIIRKYIDFRLLLCYTNHVDKSENCKKKKTDMVIILKNSTQALLRVLYKNAKMKVQKVLRCTLKKSWEMSQAGGAV